MICKCGSHTASKGWCFEGKHPRKSPKAKHTVCVECGAPHRSHGLCEMHYKRAYRAGLIPKQMQDDANDFWEFVKKELAA